jgi:Ca2+-binding RTX toxin-like protein
VRNEGNEPASGVHLATDRIVGGAMENITSTVGGCDTGTGTCDVGMLEPGGSATVTFAVRASRGPGDLTVDVQVSDSSGGEDGREAVVKVEDCDLTGTDGRDVLRGTSADDSICGLRGSDRLFGRGGDDVLDGGLGQDSLYGGAGNDRLLARDGERDRVDCGPGYDTVLADPLDRVARNCENVQRQAPLVR